MTKNEALKMALEALERFEGNKKIWPEAITAIKQALANEALEKKAKNARELGLNYEPEPKYVAFMDVPQRTWVGLTNEEIYDMYNEPRSDAEMIAFAQAIEAKLKEKNT
jgi:hypothetical protein